MGLLAFGNNDKFECADFDDWWASLPPEFKVARGDARRAWEKLRPDAKLRFQMKQAVFFQSKTEKWKQGFHTTPDRWIRGERWEDYCEAPPKQAESCNHTPRCNSPQWHMVVCARERGEI